MHSKRRVYILKHIMEIQVEMFNGGRNFGDILINSKLVYGVCNNSTV